METDVIYRKLQEANRDLEDFEDDFHRTLIKIDEEYQENNDTYRHNLQLIETEAEFARYFVQKLKLEEHTELLSNYLQSLVPYQEEFEQDHRRRESELALFEDEVRQDFRKKRAIREEKIEKLRREYGQNIK